MTGLSTMAVEDEGGSGRRRIHLREISGGEGELPLETVGQDLRAARLRRGDEIAEVSQTLKIRKDHLNAVEQDRLEDLPGKTYAIGFVRSYARYLGLDSEQMVERFKQQIAGRSDESSAMLPPIQHDDHRRLPQGWRIIAGVVILLLGYGIWHMLTANRDTSENLPPPPVLNPPKVATVKPVSPPPPVQAATPSPAQDQAPADSTPAPSSGSAAAPAPAPASASAQPVAVPSPAIGKAGSGPQLAAVPAMGAGQVFGGSNKNSRVILRSRGTTHIEVRGPGGMVYINRTLGPGDSYRLPNIVGLSLTTTDAGAVEVDLDGMAMGNAGGDLQPVGDVSLDPQAIVDRFHRNG